MPQGVPARDLPQLARALARKAQARRQLHQAAQGVVGAERAVSGHGRRGLLRVQFPPGPPARRPLSRLGPLVGPGQLQLLGALLVLVDLPCLHQLESPAGSPPIGGRQLPQGLHLPRVARPGEHLRRDVQEGLQGAPRGAVRLHALVYQVGEVPALPGQERFHLRPRVHALQQGEGQQSDVPEGRRVLLHELVADGKVRQLRLPQHRVLQLLLGVHGLEHVRGHLQHVGEEEAGPVPQRLRGDAVARGVLQAECQQQLVLGVRRAQERLRHALDVLQ
mmetsp:Transcript_20456/g.57630  ORF Transcript_20456/g.57630 Transcript_20456/m.57630 type:complete len:277 (-) Transcript_20456:1159-1989(-)